MSNEHILIVDDEADIRELLRTLLMREGYITYEASSGADMRAKLATCPIQLITLDLNLGGEDGLALAREARSIRDVPIIMISAKAEDVDRIVGLEVGADDYIVKPFNLREVLARVRAVLRRSERGAGLSPPVETATHFQFGDWVLNPGSRDLRKTDGTVASLTSAEFNLLEAFLKRPGRVLTRDNLLDVTKGQDASQFDRSIDTLIGRLRKKIEPDPEVPIYLKTVRGAGYIFAASVVKR